MSSTAQSELFYDERDEAIRQLHEATNFYTVPTIARALIKRSGWPHAPGRLLDPSCGDGAFIVTALSMLEFKPNDVDAVLRVRGYEIYEPAVTEARRNVTEHLVSRGWTPILANETAVEMIRKRDFLVVEPDEIGFTLIIGNPPFLRVGRLPEFFRKLYSKIVPSYARGDILYAFLDRCSEMLPATGKIALISSDRWLLNFCTAELRAKIGRRLGISHLVRLDQNSSFYRPKYRRKGTPPRIHPIEVILESAGENTTPLTQDSLVLDATGLAADQSRAQHTLSDIATIRLGPYMGPPGSFVVDEDTARKLTGAKLVPVVGPNEIPPDRDVLAPTRRYAIITDDKEPIGPVAEHLKSVFHKMPSKCRVRGQYWRPYEPMNIPLTGPRVLVPRIARRVRVIDIPDNCAPIDHNIQIIAPNGVSLQTIRQVLLSEETDQWIRNNARHIDNGYLDITVTLLRRLPVPEKLFAEITPTGT